MEPMTHYESLRFMLLLPFSMEGGDTADFSRDEILTVLRLAKNIHESAQAAECAAATLGDYVARAEAAEAEVARLRAAISEMADAYAAYRGKFGGTGIAGELRAILSGDA